ncbi:MAG: aromatic ring-hydroxylating dioxygenase subunit alpha [Burkholderiaceae bacterium]
MTLPADSIIARTREVNALMAGPQTPLIFNEWYCAGFGSEIGRTLLKRKFLGRNIVLYRTESGAPVALDDRCAHRSFPLSSGHLEGDTLVCGYHGFCYNREGNCTKVPSQERVPRNIGVHNYPLHEHGRLVWIWMGDPALAAQQPPPLQPWMDDPSWDSSTGYLHLPANYVGLHENLLDLTHIEFLHAATLGLGSPGYAAFPFESLVQEGHYGIERRIQPTGLPPVFSQTTGLADITTAARVSRTDYFSPAMAQVSATYFDGAQATSTRPEFSLATAHLLTPESQTTTHYFIDHAWNWGQGDARVQALMHEGLFAAFQEDVIGLSLVAANVQDSQDDPQFMEVSCAADAVAMAMRRHLKARAEAEHASKAFRA